MPLFRIGGKAAVCAIMIVAFTMVPLLVEAQEVKTVTSKEFGFTMKYPASWVKIDNPKGNYYVVFQAPDLTENFRSRIHVAAHRPVKDPLKVFLQEMRNGIKDLQKKSGAQSKKKQTVRILQEGEFKCDVPGAYFFFIQALEDKLKIWMDIVIVFYKHDDTLLRVSCLAPSKVMEKYHQLFNDVLVSVKFLPEAGPAARPSKPSAVPPPSPGTVQPQMRPAQPQMRPAQPQMRPAQPPSAVQPQGARGPIPRGPLRKPGKPSTGIVE
ncbi:MAG: hypothetical protein P8182_08000 [Deltaproteobacteria bacterium]